ncbi:MAG: DUF2892 domain-containing protein [Planctomycetaceae bacterium]
MYVICKSGSRGSKACEQLAASGLDVVNVDGGTEAWAAAGLPVVRGKASMSLERQVRIAAGLLVLVGVTLAYLIHPAWMGLSAFVGAGLVFAGITDTCGMGLMLAKMPWNQVRGQVHGGSGPACDSSARSSERVLLRVVVVSDHHRFRHGGPLEAESSPPGGSPYGTASGRPLARRACRCCVGHPSYEVYVACPGPLVLTSRVRPT